MLGRLIIPALALGLLALPATASATGGVWCDATDANLDFHFKASSSRDGTGGWFGFEGALEVKTVKLPATIGKFAMADDVLTERWWDGKDVKLLIQKSASEAENFARVQLEVMTTAVEEADYRGTYELLIYPVSGDSVTLKGKVTCSAE